MKTKKEIEKEIKRRKKRRDDTGASPMDLYAIDDYFVQDTIYIRALKWILSDTKKEKKK